MKNLILITALLFGAFGFAQDFKFIDQIKSIPNKEAAISIANEFSSYSTTKLRLHKSKVSEQSKTLKVIFVPVEVSDQDIEDYNVSDSAKEKYLTVVFAIDQSSYRLLELQTNYQSMFPIWKRYFNTEANPETTLSDYKSQHLKDNSKKIDFYIQNKSPYWILVNQS